MLDLSAAFDTVNHHQLICKLRDNFNITGKVLSWLKSIAFLRSIERKRSCQKTCYVLSTTGLYSCEAGHPDARLFTREF